MKKNISKAAVLLFSVLLLLLSISKSNSDKIRGTAAATLAPSWGFFSRAKMTFFNFFHRGPSPSMTSPTEVELQRLSLENQLLRAELMQLTGSFNKEADAARAFDVQIIPARVIFRSPTAWDHSLWINVGRSQNVKAGRDVIMKNSPIVVGNSVVGVVDYVGVHQARVRLITDAGLPLSVRVQRLNGSTVQHLAKGELQGAIKRKGRGDEFFLRGVGFNYDFPDDLGPARDLRTGKAMDPKIPAVPLVKTGDLLVTTGLDGVFPAGLHVARVTKISPLKEGDYYYELEAKPAVNGLDDLSTVFILKPVGYDPEDLPQTVGD